VAVQPSWIAFPNNARGRRADATGPEHGFPDKGRDCVRPLRPGICAFERVGHIGAVKSASDWFAVPCGGSNKGRLRVDYGVHG